MYGIAPGEEIFRIAVACVVSSFSVLASHGLLHTADIDASAVCTGRFSKGFFRFQLQVYLRIKKVDFRHPFSGKVKLSRDAVSCACIAQPFICISFLWQVFEMSAPFHGRKVSLAWP